ncbi:hypothetical protein JXB28_02415 [Candidatus Woesearchaeota archaeon]|nr:hypothetical protein [Candidatus Woesearchaeota archaeon]
MALDELIDQATIGFVRAVSIREMEIILERVAKELPARITYCKNEYVNLMPEKKKLTDYGTASIKGTISRLDNAVVFDSFETQHCNSDTNLIKGMMFFIVPGWEAYDYRPEVRQLWNDTRSIVDDYFNCSHRNL